jgi:chromosome segregation ATPase
VDPKAGAGKQKITSVKAVRGIITTVTKLTEEKSYRVVNRSQTDRTLLIEHPNRTSQQFKFVDTPKPVEDTPEVFRFQTSIKAGETSTFVVKEEKDVSQSIQLTNNADDTIRYFINLSEASDALKAKLNEALKIKGAWDVIRRQLQQVQADLNRLSQDQDRIRRNLRETPKEAEVYGKYLKKLDDQEKEIDALTAKQKKLMDDEFAARKKYDDYLANISD